VSVIRRAGIALLLVACGRQPQPSPDATPPDVRNAEITVVVKNQHWLDINVYLLRGTASDRLATVTGASEKVVSVPWTRIGGSGQLRLRADPIGQSGELYTEVISVRPGSVVEWTIGSGLRQSNVGVY
jgi:hypothetical protein